MKMKFSKDVWDGVYSRTLKDAIAEILCSFVKILPRGIKHDSMLNKLRKKIYQLCGMKIGHRSYIYNGVTFICPFNVSLGKDSFINYGCLLSSYADIIIGNRVSIGYNVSIITESHKVHSPDFEVITKPVIIEDNVWIGANAVILGGVTLAEGTVVAAGAVVTESTEKYSVYAGIPAKKIKERTINE
jgi:acetyltransferase-like isoleucine patch superfamily enzyme